MAEQRAVAFRNAVKVSATSGFVVTFTLFALIAVAWINTPVLPAKPSEKALWLAILLVACALPTVSLVTATFARKSLLIPRWLAGIVGSAAVISGGVGLYSLSSRLGDFSWFGVPLLLYASASLVMLKTYPKGAR